MLSMKLALSICLSVILARAESSVHTNDMPPGTVKSSRPVQQVPKHDYPYKKATVIFQEPQLSRSKTLSTGAAVGVAKSKVNDSWADGVTFMTSVRSIPLLPSPVGLFKSFGPDYFQGDTPRCSILIHLTAPASLTSGNKLPRGRELSVVRTSVERVGSAMNMAFSLRIEGPTGNVDVGTLRCVVPYRDGPVPRDEIWALLGGNFAFHDSDERIVFTE